MKTLMALLLCTVLLSACSGSAKQTGKGSTQSPAANATGNAARHSGPRLALLIGNSNYGNQGMFRSLGHNPRNDVEHMQKALAAYGFQSTVLKDANLGQMDRQIANFIKNIPRGGTVLFYYSGHGVHYRGNSENYLIPVGRTIHTEGSIKSAAVSAHAIKRDLEASNAGVRIMLLDACREYVGNSKGVGERGMRDMQPEGSIIGFASTLGTAAYVDHNLSTSVYTGKVLQAMSDYAALPFEQLLKYAGAAVVTDAKAHGSAQMPRVETGTLSGDFCLGQCLDWSQTQRIRQENNRLKQQLGAKQARLQEQAQAQGLREENSRLQQQLLAARQTAEAMEKRAQVVTTTPVARQFAQNAPTTPPVLPTSTGSASSFFQDTLRNGTKGPQMASIPAGSFRMGDIQGGGGSDEQPVHQVSVAAFAMSRHEITLGEFQSFVQATGYQGVKPSNEWGCKAFMQPHFSQTANHPVVCITWLDAVAYTEWLSRETGNGYHLPTEAQWEYAARVGSESKYWWGNAIGNNKANCRGCGSRWDAKQTAPVGSFSANAFGLFDTVGNAWEWSCSAYENKYKGQEKTCLPDKKDNKNRVLRGGSWDNGPDRVRSAYRYTGRPSSRYVSVGFRVARIY
ncbi:SUMF1/EgtB/PvdO family nonheme iron enzyme [Candidatus Venteria ishoeyi]|uniref:SUMF1/EgtB/PvdO family nonheme iron enzyme n=1 Tax=Candidatus Venteria ishoeyi TaxID=1899563 RepID=UPI0025A579E8|nr:SUMF1/EgtB/PvdO family nonheme iron enzyme [Candidatus Venteria ishoeyi]MDM8545985.1 SUMF1/EgtB/PvdO family nonheme iron enzyme [Candidatus Venteria ishoeyi]